jgi:hypothetical protein
MTKQSLQDMVIAKLQDELTDTFTIREKITSAFTGWFQALAVPPAPPAPPPAEGEGGEGGA